MKKRGQPFRSSPSVVGLQALGLFDGAHRADTCAGTAVDARIRIDLVDIAGGDGSDRAFVDAGAASGAIFSDFVSHCVKV